MEKLNKNAWNKIFKEKGKIFRTPQEDIPKVVNFFKKHKVKRVLDLGCGSGRHLIYLLKNGFEAYGIDIAYYGIKIAKEWLKKEKLKANLQIGDIYKKLPYLTDFFDAIISIRTLNHGRIRWIKRCVREMERILKPKGFIFITVHKHLSKKYIPKEKLYGIKWIGPRTYVILGGPEKNMPHYRFNKKILLDVFKNFDVVDFWVDSENYYCLLGQKKY
ncbi:MAG: class I SAM-dependent methyltransferase [Candidatus Aenigmatarchaeota archaeon]